MLPIVATSIFLLNLPKDKAIVARINRYISDAVTFDQFSGAVLVSNKGKILLRKGYGYANIELKIANKPNTKFRIGSVSKQFTAVAIMQLQERGKLKISDPISKFIKDTPATWDGITIEHLLNHTSGLVNYTALKEATGDFLKTSHSHEETLALFRDKPLESKPGEVYRYNNSGYYLLGMIIENCSGQSLSTYLRENIFKVAGMVDTDDEVSPRPESRRALSYQVENGVTSRATSINMNNLFAIGGISSTVEDLWKWEKALRTGTVLSKTSVAEMQRPGKGNYGYGLIIDNIGEYRRVYHDGGVNDFSTSLQHLTDEDVTVIAISNRGNDGGIRVAYDVIGWLCDTPATMRGIQPELLTESAEASFTRISEAKKRFPIFYVREAKIKELGNYLVTSGNKPQALELFKLNTMLYPKSSDAHYQLALHYSGAQQLDLARQHVKIALDLDPKNEEALKLDMQLQHP